MTASFAYFTFSIGFLSGIVLSLLVVIFVFAKIQKTKPNKTDAGDQPAPTSDVPAPPSSKTSETDDNASKSGGA